LTELRTAYDGSGKAWARGPSRLFDLLANRVIEPFATRLRGATVLDVGAGTGAVSRALRRAGASPVAVDASADMLAHVGDSALLAVVGDVCSLPFLDAAFDAAVSAFAISHVDNPARALAEMRRVVRPPGLIVVAVFGAAPANVSKDVIHEVAVQFGYEPPPWYRHLKAQTEPLSNTPDLLRGCAQAAGLEAVVVDDIEVDSEISAPGDIVDYRTGMAHLAPFVSSLTAAQRERFMRDATNAVRERGQPIRPRVLIMSSRCSA
jgi:ubiquinone/menaquinone biosynthesis C-methylase UbiE